MPAPYIQELSTLLFSSPPPFIYVEDGTNPRFSADSILSTFSSSSSPSPSPKTNTNIKLADIDGICAFTPRLIYERTTHQWVGYTPTWKFNEEKGKEGGTCEVWSMTEEDKLLVRDFSPSGSSSSPLAPLDLVKWNESLDGWLYGIRAVYALLVARQAQAAASTTNSQVQLEREPSTRLVLLVTHPERIKQSMPELFVALTRLDELVSLSLLGN